MPRLTVGTSTLFDSMIPDHKSLHEFDEIDALLDWKRIEGHLACVYGSKAGGASYPPIMMFRAMLLQVWHNISDVQTEKMLSRDLLFRRFCGLSLADSVPDHSTISRFRSELHKLVLYAAAPGEKDFLICHEKGNGVPSGTYPVQKKDGVMIKVC